MIDGLPLKNLYLNQIQQKLDVLIVEKESQNEDTTDYHTLKKIVDLVLKDKEILSQFEEYNEAIVAMAQLDFSKRLKDSGNEDIFTYITTSLNLLAEELECKVTPVHYLEHILDKLDCAGVFTDETGFIQFANKKFEEYTNIEKGKLEKASIFSFFPSEFLSLRIKPGVANLKVNLLSKGNSTVPVILSIEEVKGINDIANGLFYQIKKA